MLRNILGAIAGYVVMVVIVMAGIGVAWLVLGGEGAFQGDTPNPSTAWIGFDLVCALLGAFAGGFVAHKIGRSLSAVKILVALMLVLGAYLAITAESRYAELEPVDKPVAEMTFVEAGRHARTPAWYDILLPVVGAAGALWGGYKAAR